MSEQPSIPPAHPVPSYLVDGVRIAAILLVWGAIAAVLLYGMNDVAVPFERVWRLFGLLFVIAGVLNGILYMLYRTIDYRHETG